MYYHLCASQGNVLCTVYLSKYLNWLFLILNYGINQDDIAHTIIQDKKFMNSI